jgi:hypothetical protein
MAMLMGNRVPKWRNDEFCHGMVLSKLRMGRSLFVKLDRTT